MEQHPYLWILKADPAKYIKSAPATVAVLIKAAEGAAALMLSFRVFGRFLEAALHGTFTAALPRPLIGLYTGGVAERALLSVMLFALFLFLLATAAEAAALLVLRFGMVGADVLKIIQTVRLVAAILLLAAAFVWAAILIVGAAMRDLRELPRTVIPSAVCLAALSLAVSYQRGLLAVFSAIEYELRLDFKQTEMGETKLGRDSFLLGLICLLGGAALAVLSRRGLIELRVPTPWLVCLGFMAVKYFAVFKSYGIFRRCHR